MKSRLYFRSFFFFILMILLYSISSMENLTAQTTAMSYEDYIRGSTASEEEIDVFLNDLSWAQFDQDVGYILGNYYPKDGWNNSRTISTVRKDGARSSFNYTGRPCRINTYGNSFTQCHQANDAETWQEYLAGHLGEPVRNYGMGGFGVYQAYRRMLREEQTEKAAEYLLFYIWGDDHLRSLLRCRYALTQGWNKKTDGTEGTGKMFHGNFWPNVEMNLSTGLLEEHESRIRDREKLVQMTDPDWMYENLKDDLALQLYLFKLGKISEMDVESMKRLAQCLGVEFNAEAEKMREEAGKLLNHYGFASTIYILKKSREFAKRNGKKLMVILFDPGTAMKQLILGESRTDQVVVDFLNEEKFNYFDMNLVHAMDYKIYKLDLEAYYDRYFMGHYNPAGNHFFAYSIAPKIVQWLNPKPFTYQSGHGQAIDFEGYLEGY